MDLKEQELAEQYLRDYDKALEEYELPEAVGPIEVVHLQWLRLLLNNYSIYYYTAFIKKTTIK